MEFHNRQSIYLQIADFICENILLKKWTAGEKIPSVRDMAISIEVNPNTVMRTYAYLQEKGIINNQRGVGYFVGEDSYENTLRFKRQEFIDSDLIRVFKSMEILGISQDEFLSLYQNYKTDKEKHI